jgi:hypothetical protein
MHIVITYLFLPNPQMYNNAILINSAQSLILELERLGVVECILNYIVRFCLKKRETGEREGWGWGRENGRIVVKSKEFV